MDKKEFYDMINRVIGDKVFQYEGPIMVGLSLDVVIDFKFKIVGDVKLRHMGEPKNYVGIDVTVLNITPPTLDGFIPDIQDNRLEISDRMYYMANNIENYVWRVFQYFSVVDIPVLTSIRFTGERHNPMEGLNEGRSEKKGIVRKIVQDIIRVFKKGDGEYTLPEDISSNMTYDFPSLNTEFTVEVKIDEDNTIEGFDIDGGYYDDEETFEIHIQYNPKFFPETYYDLIGELNELVRHELQHLIQSEMGIDRPTDETDPEKYYLQPHELDAQIAGFKRLSKIRKEPFEKTVIDWFNKNKTLSDDAKERVINVILKTKK
jgi:hypothetical protein